jgi:hypothetical protein
MKMRSILTIGSMIFALCGAAQASSLKVECLKDDESKNTSTKTIEQEVDYVVVDQGETSGYLRSKDKINLRPDKQVFSSSDRCYIVSTPVR